MVTNSDKTNDNHIFMSVKEVNSMVVGLKKLNLTFYFVADWSDRPAHWLIGILFVTI